MKTELEELNRIINVKTSCMRKEEGGILDCTMCYFFKGFIFSQKRGDCDLMEEFYDSPPSDVITTNSMAKIKLKRIKLLEIKEI